MQGQVYVEGKLTSRPSGLIGLKTRQSVGDCQAVTSASLSREELLYHVGCRSWPLWMEHGEEEMRGCSLRVTSSGRALSHWSSMFDPIQAKKMCLSSRTTHSFVQFGNDHDGGMRKNRFWLSGRCMKGSTVGRFTWIVEQRRLKVKVKKV
ncbi:hypothetical protein EI94DRAFT_865684 [Lactarius quietus]|nr:hypothetical protein EI94DRAFT_865684 [Lactarius quietus]